MRGYRRSSVVRIAMSTTTNESPELRLPWCHSILSPVKTRYVLDFYQPGSNRFNFTFSPFPIYFKMQVLYSWILKSNNNKYSPKFIVCKKLLNFHFICDQRFRVVYNSDWLVDFKMIMRFYSTLSFIKCRLIPNRYFVQEQTGIPCFMLR